MEPATTFDRSALLRFADLATEALAAERERIDSLNVYPVPDGDTGTNMYLTLDAARDELRAEERDQPESADDQTRLAAAIAAFIRGALVGARGNSGVILSQLIGALLRRLARSDPDETVAAAFAEGLGLAADAAYAAVGTPVEGTILTVARAAADAALAATTGPSAHLEAVVVAAATGAREALRYTPEQLPVLAAAGVVDAGAYGLCVVLDAAVTALTGRRREPDPTPIAHRGVGALPTGDLTEDGPSYEVMYLLDAPRAFTEEAARELRTRLGELGDSVVVVGGDGLWNVHVHTDDVGAAVEAGLDVGRPRRIRVTHFAEQRESSSAGRGTAPTRRVVLAYAFGDGLGALFAEAGARVMDVGPSGRPGTVEFEAAMRSSIREGAGEVLVLPNDSHGVESARAAARIVESDTGARVVVIPTVAQVQGLAALAVHEEGRSLDSDVIAMTSAARGTRHGAVTVATNQAMTTVGPCEIGDVLGVLQGDFAVIGEDLVDVATTILRRMLDAGGELVTLVAGSGAEELPQHCQAWIESSYPGVDVITYEGGQQRYPLFMAVE
ncbi:MAG: DAK2 domain-containing protein [Marmoricola sp.]